MIESGNNSPAKPALSERVRSLRLSESSDATSGAAWRSWIPWAICVFLFCAAGVFALEAFSPINDDLIKKLAQERGLNVGKGAADSSVGKLVLPGAPGSSSSSVEISLESKGYLIAYKLIQVSPKITGTVLKLNIEEGKEVPKDFVLAELEDIEYQSDLDHAIEAKKSAEGRLEELRKYREAEIRQTKADLDDSIFQRDQAKAKFERTVVLKQRNAVSPEDYEAAEFGFRSLEARTVRLQLAYDLMRSGPRDAKIATAIGDIGQAKADLKKANWRWENTLVKAPIKGIILSKKTEEGNIVNPSAFSNGLSASLCEMANLHDLEVDLSIAERDIAKVFDKQECRIRAEAFPGRIYRGYVSRMMPIGDRGKSSVPVRVCVQFPAQDQKGQPLPLEKQGAFLRPDMGAIVTFLNREATEFRKVIP
jgi:HlyD family secretion protein